MIDTKERRVRVSQRAVPRFFLNRDIKEVKSTFEFSIIRGMRRALENSSPMYLLTFLEQFKLVAGSTIL